MKSQFSALLIILSLPSLAFADQKATQAEESSSEGYNKLNFTLNPKQPAAIPDKLVATLKPQFHPHDKSALGDYYGGLHSKICPLYFSYLDKNKDYVVHGVAVVGFRITKSGNVKDVKVISNTSNRFLAEIAIRAIQDARLEPLSEKLISELGHNWMDVNMNFNLD